MSFCVWLFPFLCLWCLSVFGYFLVSDWCLSVFGYFFVSVSDVFLSVIISLSLTLMSFCVSLIISLRLPPMSFCLLLFPCLCLWCLSVWHSDYLGYDISLSTNNAGHYSLRRLSLGSTFFVRKTFFFLCLNLWRKHGGHCFRFVFALNIKLCRIDVVLGWPAAQNLLFNQGQSKFQCCRPVSYTHLTLPTRRWV